MLELQILKLFLKREMYTKYRERVKIKPEEKELRILYQFLDDLMLKYDRDVSLDEFSLFLPKDYQHLVSVMRESVIHEDMVLGLLKQQVERAQAYQLALLSIDVSEGRKPLSDVLNFYSRFEEQEKEEKQDEFVTDDIEELWNETIHKPGLRWRLNALNQSLGSLRKGDFGFIFARPETGKTTFLASEITHFASQTTQPILWFNNEEGGYKVKVRIMQATLNNSLVQLYSDRKSSYNRYMELTKGNIKLKDSATITKRQVEALCRELNPSLVVFDQIDKIKGFDADREDLRLGAIYIWARELAKQYCPVIGVCQADVTGEGKKWLTMDNVANAKTSKQAEADWILGIGTVHDAGYEFVRYLHISKNKLSGDEDSIPELRHGKMEVLIRPDCARYADHA